MSQASFTFWLHGIVNLLAIKFRAHSTTNRHAIHFQLHLRLPYEFIWVHFTVISAFISVISVPQRTDPSRKRSIKIFSVDLPQPAYAFVSDMSVWREPSKAHMYPSYSVGKQTTSCLSPSSLYCPHHITYPHMIWNDVSAKSAVETPPKNPKWSAF